jgi:hypothetical protein
MQQYTVITEKLGGDVVTLLPFNVLPPKYRQEGSISGQHLTQS